MPHAPVGANLADYDAAFAADCARARALLLEAGYGPAGRAFPTIEIHYNTSEAHRDCAEVIADGWRRRLGIDAKLLNQEWKVYLDTQRTLGYDVSRSSWVGDYPDPNTFLDVWLTGGENNRTGWGDPRYDELVRAASREPDPARRLELLGRAEALLLEELPVLPIYGYVSQNLVKPRLGGFFENLQDEHMPKFLYWMDDEELARKRAALPTDRAVVAPGGPPEGLYAPAAARLRSGGTDG
jgi:oligopeptide transport system substrate-binding protein